LVHVHAGQHDRRHDGQYGQDRVDVFGGQGVGVHDRIRPEPADRIGVFVQIDPIGS